MSEPQKIGEKEESISIACVNKNPASGKYDKEVCKIMLKTAKDSQEFQATLRSALLKDKKEEAEDKGKTEPAA